MDSLPLWLFFSPVVKYLQCKVYHCNHFKVQFSGTDFIHNVMQPSLVSSSRTFSSPQMEPLQSLCIPSSPSSRQSLICLLCLWIYTYSGYFIGVVHTVCVLLCLVSFTWHIVNVYPYCHMYQYFIPFFSQIIFHCMEFHILSIQSSVNGQLGCFYLLAIVNRAAMNICIQIFI